MESTSRRVTLTALTDGLINCIEITAEAFVNFTLHSYVIFVKHDMHGNE